MPFNPLMALGAGICSAMAISAIYVGGVLAMPLFYLAPLPLYMAGLGIGGAGAAIAIGTAMLATGMIGGVYFALTFAATNGVPALVLCRQALTPVTAEDGSRSWRSAGDLVGVLAAIAVLTLAAVAVLLASDPEAGSLAEGVAGHLSTALSMLGGSTIDPESAVFLGLVKFFPGMAISGLALMHVINGAASERILSKSGRSRRPRLSYTDLVLPDWLSWLLVIAGGMAVVLPGDMGYIGNNLLVIASVPFLLLGLAVAHTLLQGRRNGGFALVALYLFFVLVPGLIAFALIGTGIIEQWIGLRKRMQAGKNQENE